MHVAYSDSVSGSSRYICELSERQARLGHPVSIALPERGQRLSIYDGRGPPAVRWVPRRPVSVVAHHPTKGAGILIDAIQRAPEADVVVAFLGDGVERAALEARAAGDPHIRFLGLAASPPQRARYDLSPFDPIARRRRLGPTQKVIAARRSGRAAQRASTSDRRGSPEYS